MVNRSMAIKGHSFSDGESNFEVGEAPLSSGAGPPMSPHRWGEFRVLGGATEVGGELNANFLKFGGLRVGDDGRGSDQSHRRAGETQKRTGH